MCHILIVVGTRPNFIKVTQFKKVNEQLGSPFDIKIVHTGQHYDDNMSRVFFEELDIPPPDHSIALQCSVESEQLEEMENGPTLIVDDDHVDGDVRIRHQCQRIQVVE